MRRPWRVVDTRACRQRQRCQAQMGQAELMALGSSREQTIRRDLRGVHRRQRTIRDWSSEVKPTLVRFQTLRLF
jgi:hypothetical protein